MILVDATYDVCTNTLLVDRKRLHGQLHTVKTGRFPHEVDDKVVGDLRWHSLTLPQLEGDLIRDICEGSGQPIEFGGTVMGYPLFGILMT